jgi:cellulose synthase/poly-beta-1,6-N-acetylglucosamine synthase-like glycosyltransferase
MLLEFIFWICLLKVGYAYFGYPLVLAALARQSRQAHASAAEEQAWPSLTILVAARNEERRIGEKLEDILAQDYPVDRRQVLVVSDGSTDGTANVVQGFAHRGVQCIELARNVGKESAQSLGIAASTGDVLVFTDVATRIGGAGLPGIAAAFRSDEVGAVSSEDRFVAADGRPAGEGLYVRYEMWLRQLESRVRGLVGLSGSLFAVRRELCDEWPTNVPSDLVVALRCARRGLKAISLPEVHGIYPDLKRDSAEFARKRRTAVRGMAGLASAIEVLNFRHYGLFAFQVWSHKLARWAVPWFLVGALVTNVLLLDAGMLYRWLLVLQLAGYTLAVAGMFSSALRRFGLVRIAYFFVLSNAALALAAIDFLRGRRVVQWEPSVR